MHIALESADQPEVVALIEALDAYQMPMYPLESHHGVDIAALAAPNVLFAVARDEQGAAAVLSGACSTSLKRRLPRADVSDMRWKPAICKSKPLPFTNVPAMSVALPLAVMRKTRTVCSWPRM